MAKKSTSKKTAVGAAKKAVRPKLKRPLVKPVARLAAKPVARVADTPKVVKKLKSPLSKSELDEFRRMLIEKRRALIGDMNGIEAEALRTNRQEGSGDLSNMPTHPADVGTDNFEQEFTLGLLESERTLLGEINGALERIDSGTFGLCVGTGQPIGTARLRARPWAKYCIEYARMLEKGLVQPSDMRPDDEDEEDEAPAVVSEEASDEDDDFVEDDSEE